MKFKFLMVTSAALLTSCTWMGNQTHDFMQWADRSMPTYDGSHPGVENNNSAVIPDHYNGYPYAANSGRTPMNAPGVSGANTPPLPGQGIMTNPGLTPAQAASATEGGNSRPHLAMPPAMNGNAQPQSSNGYNPPPAYPSAPNNMQAPNPMGDRRMPANQLPPSAIKPVPYGALHQTSNPNDFPTEYSKPTPPGMDSTESMVPPPPI